MAIYPINKLPLEHSFAALGDAFYTRVQPTAIRNPYLQHLNNDVCQLLDIDPASVTPSDAAAWFAGGVPFPGADPLAMVYSGHQFGVWAGQLGDGRAMLLGERVNSKGERWDLQLKGSGLTPYSRMGDGRSVLRSAIREYIGGEALHGLGIPTTRALALCGSDEPVYREEVETAATIVRVAQCHVRIGTFEHFGAKGNHDQFRDLFEYAVKRWYPHLIGNSDRVHLFVQEVAARTARLMAQWMAVGFCHGVMNTDNFAINGDTIDYGPYGFLDEFDWRHICNHSDQYGRYAYGEQPGIGFWNVLRLADVLTFNPKTMTQEEHAARYQVVYLQHYQETLETLFAAKLGVKRSCPDLMQLFNKTLSLLQDSSVDYTLFWRTLSRTDPVVGPGELSGLGRLTCFGLNDWWEHYAQARRVASVGGTTAETQTAMLKANPKYIARNYLLQTIIERKDPEARRLAIDRLLTVLAKPFDEHPGYEDLAEPPPDWGKYLEVSCSS